MSAFVPNVGVPLRSANSFMGARPAEPARPRHLDRPAAPVAMADDDAPKDAPKTGFSLPKVSLPNVSLPNVSLPSVNLPFGGKKPAPDAPAPVAPRANAAVKARAPAATEAVAAPTLGSPKRAPSNVRSFPKEYQFLADRKVLNKTTYDMRIVAPSYFYTADKQGSKNVAFNDLDVYTDDDFWEHPGGWPREQALIAIDRCLKQLFGTSKLLKTDLKSIETAVLCVKQTGNLREFMREVGQSDLYRKRFFEPFTNLRFIELNFKHFLGRAPRDQAEVSEHVAILTSQGYEAEINSYFDSEEYQTLYGYTRIPSVNFDSRFPYNQNMNRTAALNGAYVTPDTISKAPLSVSPDFAAFAPITISKGLPSGWKSETTVRKAAAEAAQAKVSPLADDTPLALAAEEVAYRMKFGTTRAFWYKDSVVYEMNKKMVSEPSLEHSPDEEEEAEAILKYGSNMSKMYVGARE